MQSLEEGQGDYLWKPEGMIRSILTHALPELKLAAEYGSGGEGSEDKWDPRNSRV